MTYWTNAQQVDRSRDWAIVMIEVGATRACDDHWHRCLQENSCLLVLQVLEATSFIGVCCDSRIIYFRLVCKEWPPKWCDNSKIRCLGSTTSFTGVFRMVRAIYLSSVCKRCPPKWCNNSKIRCLSRGAVSSFELPSS
jgi:hypothetical protein